MAMQSNNGAAVQIPPPIFIMGSPRSGTTLVSQMLDSHSRIAIYHETNYYPTFFPILRFYGDLSDAANLRRLIGDLVERFRLDGNSPPAVEEVKRALVSPTFEGVLATLLHVNAQKQGKFRGGEKTPGHFLYLREIQQDFPESPVVFLMRDPRDTVLSMRKAFGESLDAAIHLWNGAFFSAQRAPRPVYLVRYEELVHQPAQVVEEMCDSLGEPYEPTMLDFFESVPELLRTHPNVGKLAGPVDPASVGNYRQMSASEIARIESACAAGMEAMGYTAITQRRAVTIEAPKRPDKLKAMIGRVRYYGFKRGRWRRGWFRWKMAIRVRARYLLSLRPLRKKGNPLSI